MIWNVSNNTQFYCWGQSLSLDLHGLKFYNARA